MYGDGYELYIIFGLIGLVAFGPTFYQLYRHADREDSLTEHARKLGLTCSRSGEQGVFMRGAYRGRAVMVGMPEDRRELGDMGDLVVAATIDLAFDALLGGKTMRYNNGDMISSVKVPIFAFLQRPLPAGLRIMMLNDPRPRPPRPNLQRLQIDPAIDERLIVEAEDAAGARRLLADMGVRDALWRLMLHASFAVDAGHATLTSPNLPTPEQLVSQLDLLVSVADALDRAGRDPLDAFEGHA